MEHLNNIKYGIAAVRVSSDKQGLQGDSPESQLQQIQIMAQRKGIIISKVFEFIESASKEIQPNQKAIDYCLDKNNQISYFLVKSIDRFTRGGSRFYAKLKDQLDDHNIQLIDTYGIISETKINTLDHLGVKYKWSVFSPTYKSEILEAERAKDEVRDILTRMIGAEIEYVRLGYAVRQPPYGYMNTKVETIHGKRTILKPEPFESKHIIAMYELRASGNKTDQEIVDIINEMGFKTRAISIHSKEDRRKVIAKRGGKPMTVKLLQKYIRKPIYAGYKFDKWTKDKPIRAQFKGLISREVFNKANRGKITIVDNGGEVRIFEGEIPPWLKRRNKNNPTFAYKNYVVCPFCHKPLLGSASRGKSGKHFPAYHCNKRGHYFRIRLHDFEDTLKFFCKHIEMTKEERDKAIGKLITQWEKRKSQNTNMNSCVDQQIKEIDSEIEMLTEKIKMVSSPDVIKIFETSIANDIQKKKDLMNKTPEVTLENIDFDLLIKNAKYYMEHLPKLLFSKKDKVKDAAMFGLLFDELPSYQDLVNGTPNFSPLIRLNKNFYKGKNQQCDSSGSRTHDYLDESQVS